MKKNYKVCVYAICKDEMKRIDKWMESMSEADYIVVLDTGSTDGTFSYLQHHSEITKVEQKVFSSFRFDEARNESMKLVPDDADILVCTDPDEIFEPGWCETLKQGWEEDFTRATYTYAWAHTESGAPKDVFTYDKIHTRDYYWKYPVHEILWRNDIENEKRINFGEHIYLHHYQDKETKDRRWYMDLLKLAVDENPEDAHIYHLYAREFALQGMLKECKNALYNLLRMPATYEPINKEVLLDCFVMQAQLTIALAGSSEEVIYWCDQFLKIDNSFREPYLIFTDILIQQRKLDQARKVLDDMYALTYRHYSWVEKSVNWVYADIILRGFIELYSGNYEKSLMLISQCLEYEPSSEKLLELKNICLEELNKE